MEVQRPMQMKYLLITFFVCGTAFAGGGEFELPDKQMECQPLIPSDLHPRTGWKVIPAEDLLSTSTLVAEGKAKMQRRPTLLCKDTGTGKVMPEWVVYQWWVKVKK